MTYIFQYDPYARLIFNIYLVMINEHGRRLYGPELIPDIIVIYTAEVLFVSCMCTILTISIPNMIVHAM